MGPKNVMRLVNKNQIQALKFEILNAIIIMPDNVQFDINGVD